MLPFPPISADPSSLTSTPPPLSSIFQLHRESSELPHFSSVPSPASQNSHPSSPRTPPPTPFLASYLDSPHKSPTPLMLELTRLKLERAAQGQLTGGRGAPSLRQIVLLSNVFGATQPPWVVDNQDDQRVIEEDNDYRRKLDEERWLDGVLEEMLIEEDEDEDYVELSFKTEDRGVGDSGFLEVRSHLAPDERILTSLESVQEEQELGELCSSNKEFAADNSTKSEDKSNHSENSGSLLPVRVLSPPIDVPERSHRAQQHYPTAFANAIASTSSSPPSNLPSLTPDCSPPTRESHLERLASSADSFEIDEERWTVKSEFDIEHDRKRLGFLALDLSPTSDPFSLDPTPGRYFYHPKQVYTCLEGGDDVFKSLDSFGLPPNLDSGQRKTTHSQRPTRSLSAPGSPRAQTTSLPSTISPTLTGNLVLPSFDSRGSIVKSYYDCIDFGSCPLLTTTPDAAFYQSRPIDRHGEKSRLELRPTHWLSQLSKVNNKSGITASWRSRSLSPEPSQIRREWAQLGIPALEEQ